MKMLKHLLFSLNLTRINKNKTTTNYKTSKIKQRAIFKNIKWKKDKKTNQPKKMWEK